MSAINFHFYVFLELSASDLSHKIKCKINKSEVFDESIIKMLPGDDNVIEMKKTQVKSGRHESIQKSIM